MEAEFVIYYSDGSTYSNQDGAWADAPPWDIQVVLFRHPTAGWAMRHNNDYYRLAEDGTVVGMDFIGMIDYIANMLGLVKVGRMLTQAEFDEVYQTAKRDMAALKKQGD